MLKRLVSIVLASVWMAGCATQAGLEKDGRKYGVTQGTFRGRWWSYYERGSSFNAGEFYQKAEADLREAVRGRSVDTWSARTYGLHFVEYFPNRELGVACFHQGRLDDAETYLITSLKQIDTERAHHYLDLVKKARISKGELKDDVPPALGTSLVNGAVLASREVPLDIRATDTVGVETVKLNGQPLHQRGSALEVAFKQELVLDEGTHTLTLDADNLGGKAASQSVTVSVDITGPSIGIFEPPADLVTDASSVKLRGASADSTGLASVKLGDKTLAEPKGAREAAFESELPLKDGANQFVVVSTDTAGNETRCAVSVYKGTRDKTVSFLMGLPDRLLQPLRFAHVRFSAPPIMVPGLADRVKPAVGTAGTGSGSPIEIELKYPKEDTDSHKNEVRVTGRVVSENKVSAVEFNGQKYAVIAAPVVEFSKRIVLAQGENPIRIGATDDQGHAVNKEVKVLGKPVVLDTPESKMSVSVMGFGGAADEKIRQSLRAQTESRLIDRKRFDMVDRERLAAVLQEQQLSAALADPNRAIQLGKVIPANVFLVGEVIDRGKGVEVYTRVVSTETSEIVGKFDVNIDDKNDAAKVKFGVDAIAEGLARSYPRVTGDIVKVDGKNLIFNFGKDDGVQPGMYVLVVHQNDPVKDDKTGEVLVEGDYERLGKAAIRTVSEKNCKAETVKQEGDAKLEAGMPAVTM